MATICEEKEKRVHGARLMKPAQRIFQNFVRTVGTIGSGIYKPNTNLVPFFFLREAERLEDQDQVIELMATGNSREGQEGEVAREEQRAMPGDKMQIMILFNERAAFDTSDFLAALHGGKPVLTLFHTALSYRPFRFSLGDKKQGSKSNLRLGGRTMERPQRVLVLNCPETRRLRWRITRHRDGWCFGRWLVLWEVVKRITVHENQHRALDLLEGAFEQATLCVGGGAQKKLYIRAVLSKRAFSKSNKALESEAQNQVDQVQFL